MSARHANNAAYPNLADELDPGSGRKKRLCGTNSDVVRRREVDDPTENYIPPDYNVACDIDGKRSTDSESSSVVRISNYISF